VLELAVVAGKPWQWRAHRQREHGARRQGPRCVQRHRLERLLLLGRHGETITSAGNHLATDASCALGAPTDLVTGAPGLAPLLDANGYVWLSRLLAGSPAIDAGDGPWDPATDAGCGPVDEAGTARPEDGNGDGIAVCDIGAHEYTQGFAR
jgi:hypothetical protein